MDFAKRLFATTEVRAALGGLDEAELALTQNGDSGYQHLLLSSAFRRIRPGVTRRILDHPDKIATLVRQGTSAREIVYSSIFELASDLVKSGEHHFYRGALTPEGEALLLIAYRAMDELQRIGVAQPGDIAEVKTSIRAAIATVG